jgi:hypothetical protein
MNKLNDYFILLFILSYGFTSAQTNDFNKYSLQLNFGFAITFHYDSPVNLNQCIEGCFPQEQESKLTTNAELSVYRNFDKHHGLNIGIGFFGFDYSESGTGGIGDGGFAPYTFENSWDFYGISLGYRYILNPDANFSVFAENDFIYDISAENYDVITNGLSIQPKVGVLYDFNDKWQLLAQGFFRSALTSYSNTDIVDEYKPYAYGINIGVNFNF